MRWARAQLAAARCYPNIGQQLAPLNRPQRYLPGLPFQPTTPARYAYNPRPYARPAPTCTGRVMILAPMMARDMSSVNTSRRP